MENNNENILQVQNMHVYFYHDHGVLKAVSGVNFEVDKQKTLGIVGESGCGKSVTAHSLLRIMLPRSKMEQGKIYLNPPGQKEPLKLHQMHPKSKNIRRVRGNLISMIFQEPMTSLSPVHTIENQIKEAITLHREKDKKEAQKIALEMLKKVGISDPEQRLTEYPHQLSGGMRQRAMTAMALSCNPYILIADEPTTALDVTVQAQILDLMADLQKSLAMSIIYITHDMGVIAEVADEVCVMYLGKVVEYTDVDTLFYNAQHPYTQSLLNAIPRMDYEGRLEAIKGRVPEPVDLPEVCHFYPRCDQSIEGKCNQEEPPVFQTEEGHRVKCFLYEGGSGPDG